VAGRRYRHADAGVVFQTLAIRKPELDSGIFAYAKAGFGDYIGFNSAFGYWASACVGNTFYWVFIMATIGAAFPVLGDGDTLLAAVLSTVGVWTFHFLITRGVKNAAVVNRIVTIAKIVPILVFLVILVFAFDAGVFSDNFWGGKAATIGSIFNQVKATMIITVFVFLGIEGASVYSRYARRREDIGRATVLGFLGVLSLFAMVTLLPYAVLPREEIAGLRQPSMASVLESVVGHWGAVFISVGVVVSVLGAYLAWTLMAAEVLYIPATYDDMPRFLKRENKAKVPIIALILSSSFVQLMIVVVLFAEDALNFMLDLCTSLALIPYLLSAAYAFKLAATKETYDNDPSRIRELIVGVVAVVYTLFLVVAAGPKFLLLSCVIYAPGTVLYVIARRENSLRVSRPWELALCGVIVGGHRRRHRVGDGCYHHLTLHGSPILRMSQIRVRPALVSTARYEASAVRAPAQRAPRSCRRRRVQLRLDGQRRRPDKARGSA
jgi:arginine:ornithine antiporter / lysine permease